MSLPSQPLDTIPAETVRVARAAFPHSTRFMLMRDVLGTIYDHPAFEALYPQRGKPAEVPWRLALITVMQFAADLSDRAAAEAVRSRIDWKYALSLELTDPGLHYSVLAKFRTRLVAGLAEPALIRPMCSRPSGPATAWNVLAKPSVQRSTILRWSPPIGSVSRAPPTGSSAMANALRNPAYPKAPPHAMRMPHRLGRMAYSCSAPSLMPRRPPDSVPCLRSKCSDRLGCSNTIRTSRGSSVGAQRRTSPRQGGGWTRRMTPTRPLGRNAVAPGQGTKSI
jgi:transposase